MSMKGFFGRRNTLLILGGVGSCCAFVLSSGPTIVREWTKMLEPGTSLSGTMVDAPPTGDATPPSFSPSSVPEARQIAAPQVSPAPSPSAAEALPEMLKLSLKVPMSVVGEGASESAACSAAVAEVRSAATRRCERISLQNDGKRFDLSDAGDLQCSGCGYVGDRWRCAARLTSDCKIYQ